MKSKLHLLFCIFALALSAMAYTPTSTGLAQSDKVCSSCTQCAGAADCCQSGDCCDDCASCCNAGCC
jgi:hypothetical protein